MAAAPIVLSSHQTRKPTVLYIHSLTHSHTYTYNTYTHTHRHTLSSQIYTHDNTRIKKTLLLFFLSFFFSFCEFRFSLVFFGVVISHNLRWIPKKCNNLFSQRECRVTWVHHSRTKKIFARINSKRMFCLNENCLRCAGLGVGGPAANPRLLAKLCHLHEYQPVSFFPHTAAR